jgi:hypothetical protein
MNENVYVLRALYSLTLTVMLLRSNLVQQEESEASEESLSTLGSLSLQRENLSLQLTYAHSSDGKGGQGMALYSYYYSTVVSTATLQHMEYLISAAQTRRRTR